MSSLYKGTFYLAISSFIFLPAGYVINVWLGRYLGPIEYGLYGIIISLMSVVNILQSSGVPQAVSKYVSENETEEREIYKSSFFLQNALSLVLAFLYFIFARPVSILFHDLELTPYLQLSALAFPFFGIYTL